MKENKEKNKKIDEEKGKKPNYTADGVAVWINKDKNNEEYIAIKMTGHNTIYAFKNK